MVAITEAAPSRRSAAWAVLVGGLIAAVIGLAVDIGVQAGRLSDVRSQNSARTNALAAARQDVLNVLSFDYRKLGAEFAVVSTEVTGPAKADFLKQEQAIRTNFTADHLVSVGKIWDAAVAASTATKASIVVAVDDSITVLGGARDTTPQRFRLDLTMVLVHGHWLLENLAPAP